MNENVDHVHKCRRNNIGVTMAVPTLHTHYHLTLQVLSLDWGNIVYRHYTGMKFPYLQALKPTESQ